jgi:hypothetical protein
MRYFWCAAAVVASFFAGWLFGNSRAPAFLYELFGDGKTTAAVASAIFALLALLVQYLVGAKQAVIGKQQAEAARTSSDAAMLTARNAGGRAIAAMRIGWLEALRKTLSEYHSTLVSVDDPFPDQDLRRLSDLGTQLDLMMNLNEPNQKALWDIADRIYRTNKLSDRKAMDPALMEAGRAVIKAEWEKIKRELRGDADSERSSTS